VGNGEAASGGYTGFGIEADARDGQDGRGCHLWAQVGVGDILIAAHPLGGGAYSMAAYCRSPDNSSYTGRDREILDCIFQHVTWLHVSSSTAVDASPLAQLSKREREVLQLLLEGHARKEVATRLNLSAHTVADYLKVIHKKLGVTSRAELLSKFIKDR
jgi:DNA-binding CsgD family transcriptional regulator